jgi:hypothetical protein
MLPEDIARQIRQHFTILAQSGDIAQAIATESQALSLPDVVETDGRLSLRATFAHTPRRPHALQINI